MILKSKEFIKSVIYVAGLILVLFLLRQFVFTPVIVKGHSMDPTLSDGERVIALKNTKINRFDIVTLHAPDEPGKNYIKRVIGLPGETVELKEDLLYINGEEIPEPFLDEFKNEMPKGSLFTENFALADIGAKTVPEGKLFVLGDNRQNSKDSRIIGFIDKKEIMGDVRFAIWPLNRFGFIPSVETK